MFDIQVNGCYGLDFNGDDLSVERLDEVCRSLQASGIDGILATVITDDVESMCRRIRNIARCRQQSETARSVIRGIHVEGPFISPHDGYVGAHPREMVQPASVDVAEEILDAGEGLVRIVTLAPEQDPQNETTRWLAQQGVTVSAGHCDPTPDQLRAAIDQGLTLFTHLGNGCPQMMHRHDNIIQRVLGLSEHLWICFIADNVHIPYWVLETYLEVAGIDYSIVVSDSISAAGMGPGSYSLGARKVIVDENLTTWSSDRQHLVGSAMTLPQVYRKLREELHLSEVEADKLTNLNPRTALGL